MGTITIGGETVDEANLCAVLHLLQRARMAVAVGESVRVYSIRSPTVQEEVQYSSANMHALDSLIADWDAKCRQATTGCRPSRRWQFKF